MASPSPALAWIALSCGHTWLDDHDGLVGRHVGTSAVFVELHLHVQLTSRLAKCFVQRGIEAHAPFVCPSVIAQPTKGGVDFVVQFAVAISCDS